MKNNLATSKNLKPIKPQDKLFKSFIDHVRSYKIPERKYKNMEVNSITYEKALDGLRKRGDDYEY